MKTPPKALENVLFEIGSEELPATNLADIFEQPDNVLELKLKKILESHRIQAGKVTVWATPRRIVAYLESVSAVQEAKEVMTRVLVKEEAYGADGKPSEKLLTILKHRNAALADTVIAEANGKPYVFIKKMEPAQKTAALLGEIFETYLKTLSFPKNMRWDDSGLVFPRPIRSLLCFYGRKPIRLKIGHLIAKSEVWVFSKSRRLRFAVKDIPAYFQILKKNGILLSPVERKQTISQELDRLAKASGARLYDDPFLLSEVNFLVENPGGLSAPFAEEFLKLPMEVLTVSMARKQRLFGLVDREGRVMARFLAVLDGATTDKQKKIIVKNMEGVLRAKLKDSLFFYREDTKVPLTEKRKELASLVFLKGAGSMLEKSERLVKLSETLAEDLGLAPADKKALLRAAFLAKADLLTQMVGEFPELQGIMGKYYSRENGEDEAVASAVGEQYLPRMVSDPLPATPAGAALSLLDKADLLSACFRLGLEPTSSLDPYGLRRSATAILKIILERRMPLSLQRLFVDKKLEDFMKERLKALLTDQGYREDIVEAVLAGPHSDRVYEVSQRASLLSEIAEEVFFMQACKVVERTVNILKGNKEKLPDQVNPAVFTEDLERRVFERYEAFKNKVQQAADKRDFRLATSLYAESFFDILSEFFDKVFVNDEDLNVRKNRLALLCAVKNLYTTNISDLSKIRRFQ
ncbi:MAG: glycine--tRNA ligase subunit beta [Candidatus Omnitrophica bacterium]|nr:glycine--tRNA ligase subunit beta [Candidatus Omnitrophota bacterium]